MISKDPKPVFSKPEEIFPGNAFFTTEVSAEVHKSKSCKKRDVYRVKQTLTIRNGDQKRKRRFEIRYSLDEETASLCLGSKPTPSCNGGENTKDVSVPGAQPYWQGETKKVVAFVCWEPNTGKPDVNLTTRVTARACDSVGSDPPSPSGDAVVIRNMYLDP